MTYRWLRRVLAVFGLAIAALFIYNPGGAVILGAILLQLLFSNMHPPPIAEDQLAAANGRVDEASNNLSALLQRKFPAGSSEGMLKSTLLNQGFKPLLLAPNQGRCLPQYEPRIDFATRARCHAYDPSKTYKYSWAGGVCSSNIIVWWTTDDRGDLVKVMGAYGGACL